jgi:EAL domain-containing protein (putative c-di-GMP-specific phosphodiesterase class I)
VETSDQLERLQAEGCTEVQGYMFSPPVPAGEVKRLLAALTPKLKAIA